MVFVPYYYNSRLCFVEKGCLDIAHNALDLPLSSINLLIHGACGIDKEH